MWHYVDSNGKRCAESFTGEQLVADAQVLAVFQSMELNAANGETETLAANAPILVKIGTLPPHRGRHWLAELKRIGTKIKTEEPKAPPKNDATKGGSK